MLSNVLTTPFIKAGYLVSCSAFKETAANAVSVLAASARRIFVLVFT